MNLLRSFGRVMERFYSFCGLLAALCLVAMALCILLSILSRLVDVYIGGLTETAGYLMAAANCLGLAYTFRAKGHIRINLISSRFSPQVQHKLEIWCLMVTSVITSYLAYYMSTQTYWSWQFEEVSEGADALLLWIPQSVVAFGCIVLALCTCHSLLETLAGADPTNNFKQDTQETDPHSSADKPEQQV